MEKNKPNIIFILNDHQAYYRFGWDSGVSPKTPNFDELAKEGASFSKAYTSCPLCTPSRRSMLTGLLPHNHGHLTLEEDENSEVKDKGNVFELLAEQGYENYYFGKWHTGEGTAEDYGCKGLSYPGFGNPYTTQEYKQYVESLGIEPASFNVEHVFWEPVSPSRPRKGSGYQPKESGLFSHVTGTMETPKEGHESFFIANLACDQLRKLSKQQKDRPFALFVHFYGPHPPYLASQEYLDLYEPLEIEEYGSFKDDLSNKPPVYTKEMNEPMGKDGKLLVPSPVPWIEWQKILTFVYAQISQVDAAGGLILDEIDALGIDQNTLVVWTADHGDPISSHGGHFGKEAYMSEEVLRIPLAIRWPEKIKAGSNFSELVSNIDIPVSLLDAAGTTFTGQVDGKNLFNLIDDRNVDESWRINLVCETHGHHRERTVGRTIINGKYKLSLYRFHEIPEYVETNVDQSQMGELYDLDEDPFELNNLFLDSKYQDIVIKLIEELNAHRITTGDPVSFQ